MTAGLPPELVEAIDRLDRLGRSTRAIALAAGVSQSTVSRRRRARRRAEIREAIRESESDSLRKKHPGADLPFPVLRYGAAPEIRHRQDIDQGLAGDHNCCLVPGCHGPGFIWGRCPSHSGGREPVWLLAAYGFQFDKTAYPPVPEGGLGPDDIAAILSGSGYIAA